MRLVKSIQIASVLILLIGISYTADAQGYRRYSQNDRRGDRWEYLGQAMVNGRNDHDIINVNARGGFRAIQLQVQGGEIEFQRVVVHFENGGDTDVPIRDRIQAGGRTRSIDLPGDQRRIRSVEVWFSQGNWGRRRPSLRVYGQR